MNSSEENLPWVNELCLRSVRRANHIHQTLLPCYGYETPFFQNNLYPVTFINFQMTAYMAKPTGHKSMQPQRFNCFLA